MSFIRAARFGLIGLVTLLAVACADRSTPLQPSDVPSLNRAGSSARAGGLNALARTGPARGEATVRLLVTPESGGTLSIRGVALAIPAGAVAAPVMIQMTVPRGPFLLARFQPHGLVFETAPTLTFDLSRSRANASQSLVVAYLGQNDAPADGAVSALRTFATRRSGNLLSTEIPGFSGYIVASGFH